MPNPVVQRFRAHLQVLSNFLRRLPVVGILVRAALDGPHDVAKDMAASIAYFSFLSLFPLALGLIALGSFVLTSAEDESRLRDLIVEIFPVSGNFVAQNIEAVIKLRSAAGLASVLVLLWSARKMVAAISRGINQTLGFERTYASYLSPLRNFALVISVSVLTFVVVTISPAIEVLAELNPGATSGAWRVIVDIISGHLSSFTLTGMLFAAIYSLTPYQRLPWKDLLPGIVTASVFVELGKSAFVFYFDNISHLETIYGSISSIIVLLLWLYFAAGVVIFGAAVIAANRQTRLSPGRPNIE